MQEECSLWRAQRKGSVEGSVEGKKRKAHLVRVRGNRRKSEKAACLPKGLRK